MKRRQGFVSNSSSSSFILAVNKDVKNKDIKIEISIEECIKQRLSLIEDVQKYFVAEYGPGETFEELLEGEGEWLRSRYAVFVDAINKGKDIIVGSSTNEGDTAAELAIYYGALNTLKMDDVTVIDSGE